MYEQLITSLTEITKEIKRLHLKKISLDTDDGEIHLYKLKLQGRDVVRIDVTVFDSVDSDLA